MIKVKNVFDEVEEDDGQRLWIEPIGLTQDLRNWCQVDHVLSHLGPSMQLEEWLEAHPDEYDYFRSQYHDALTSGPFRAVLVQMVTAARTANFTLLHHGDDPAHNSATALYEFLSELDAYVPPDP